MRRVRPITPSLMAAIRGSFSRSTRWQIRADLTHGPSHWMQFHLLLRTQRIVVREAGRSVNATANFQARSLAGSGTLAPAHCSEVFLKVHYATASLP